MPAGPLFGLGEGPGEYGGDWQGMIFAIGEDLMAVDFPHSAFRHQYRTSLGCEGKEEMGGRPGTSQNRALYWL